MQQAGGAHTQFQCDVVALSLVDHQDGGSRDRVAWVHLQRVFQQASHLAYVRKAALKMADGCYNEGGA